MKQEWVFIKKQIPDMGQVVEILHEFYGNLEAKRVYFAVPTKNPFTKLDEFWFWDVSNSNIVEVLLLNEIAHWRPLEKE